MSLLMALKSQDLLSKRSIILILFLVAVGVRLIALKQNAMIASDGTLYIKMAQLYWTGQYHQELLKDYAYYAFFPLLILPFYKVFGDWVLAGQWVSVLCGALTVVPLYLLALRIFNEKIAFWAALFYVICPTLVRYSTEVLRDIPFVFFFTTALWCGYRGIKDGKVVFIGLAGLFIAVSASLRIEGLALLGSLPLFLFWHGIKNDIPWKRRLMALGALFGSVVCILALCGLFFSQKGINIGEIQISGIKGLLTFRTLENQTIKKVEKEVQEKDISQAGRDFFYIARKHRFALYSSQIFYKTVKGFHILFILFLLGLIKRRIISYRQDEFLLLTIFAVFVPLFFVYLNDSNYLSTRHVFPVVVPSLIWSGVGFVELRERVTLWMKGRVFPSRARAFHWLTPLLLIVICVPLLLAAWMPYRKDKSEIKEIGLWLKDHGYAHSMILGQPEFSRLAFYADGDFVGLPNGSYEDIIRFARGKKANLLVINKKTISELSSHFLEMISSKDLQQISIPEIATPKYATTVFRVKGLGET